MATTEQDRRLDILNTLLTTPHRKLDGIHPVHKDMIDQDPLFYVRLGAWYSATGEIRDHKEMFAIMLAMSNFDGHRDVGLSLMREMPPYQLARVIDFVHGAKKTTETKVRGRTSKTVEEKGLFRNIPRSMKTEVGRYLREREADPQWFDSSVMIARKYMKRLYALMHFEPSERAQAILFEDNPPDDSSLKALKALRKCKSATDQAKVIMEHRVPYRIASTVIEAMTPTVLVALVDVMSDQELINNMGSLKKRGAFDNPKLKELISERLEKAKTGKRVAAMKASEAAKISGVSDDIAKKLEEVGDAQIKAKGRIKRPTALLIDKSGSMSVSIEIGKRIAAMVSAIMDAPLFVYAFDGMAYPIESKGEDLASWEQAFKGIQSGGLTSCGVGIEMLRRQKQKVEQIIMVTDEGETSSPPFLRSLQRYMLEVSGPDLHVTFVKCGNRQHDTLEQRCRNNNISFDAYKFDGDYYSLPGLIPYLTRESKLDLLMDIMVYPLPERKTA